MYVLLVVLLVSGITAIPLKAYAYNLEGCKWASIYGFPAQITYYNAGGSTYGPYISDAISRWNSSGAFISYESVPTNSGDIYAEAWPFGANGFDGVTSYYCTNGDFVPDEMTVAGNTTYFYSDNYPPDGIVQVYVHEFGHALGLAHNSPSLSYCPGVPIMYYSSDRYFLIRS